MTEYHASYEAYSIMRISHQQWATAAALPPLLGWAI